MGRMSWPLKILFLFHLAECSVGICKKSQALKHKIRTALRFKADVFIKNLLGSTDFCHVSYVRYSIFPFASFLCKSHHDDKDLSYLLFDSRFKGALSIITVYTVYSMLTCSSTHVAPHVAYKNNRNIHN